MVLTDVMGTSAHEVIRNASDRDAGYWIFGYATARSRTKHDLNKNRGLLEAGWATIEYDPGGWMASVLDQQVSEARAEVSAPLRKAVEAYRTLRVDHALLWRYCNGKTVLAEIARDTLKMTVDAACSLIITSWEHSGKERPEPCKELLAWIESLPSVKI